jgi:predicted metal-dependent phosphoesterase TrpH
VADDMLKVLPHIDAIEAFNSRTLSDSFNKKGAEFAQEHSIPVVAGSDAHFSSEIGNAYIVLECEGKTVEDVLSAIKRNRSELVTKKASLKRYPKTLALKISRSLRSQK